MAGDWKSVPMPPGIAALPRVNGMPIPFVTSWGKDPESVAYRRETGLTVECACTPGQGRPFIRSQCPERQRRCAQEALCSVCGTALTEEDPRVLAGVPLPESVWYMEAPAHATCMAYALQVCPHLVGAAGPDLPITLSPAVLTCEGRERRHSGGEYLVAVSRYDRAARALPLRFVLSSPVLPQHMSRERFLKTYAFPG
ncbi:hypothetical protein MRI28_31615 [Nocardiopsis dassonvillei]|uniref:hypothetical protein n=1 Tax=Nocardiopsis dassonvillei TaxID=2014 RepID=UPI0020109B71|nr:hypothetical protein [Nocardiopsis dassonvillei]MCK9874117.1 hypothetical protein [Nocardiopsis dassonvillei]